MQKYHCQISFTVFTQFISFLVLVPDLMVKEGERIVLVNPTLIVYYLQSSSQGDCNSRGQSNQLSSLGLIRGKQEAKAIRLHRSTFSDVFLMW